PLCPTEASITAALDRLAERLGKSGCTILRESAKMPDLALTARIYREMLSAIFSADIPPEARERIEAAAKTLSADDQSLAAERLRGSTISQPDSIRKRRMRGGLPPRRVEVF